MLDVVTRLSREDPTFTYHTDADTAQVILSGMGELHLEILRNRMLREFNVSARFGRPRVSYRETVAAPGEGVGEFDRRIGEAQVTGHARIEVRARPREAGTRGVPPVEVELAGSAAALPPALQRVAARNLDRGG